MSANDEAWAAVKAGKERVRLLAEGRRVAANNECHLSGPEWREIVTALLETIDRQAADMKQAEKDARDDMRSAAAYERQRIEDEQSTNHERN